ncbi:MAG: ABC transporter permease subunit [Solirubrobacterales bacterium]|nr:ABC transporter permease subunit [Solirubrobacterales bacterium]
MVVFVFAKAWPSFQANGLSWFGMGGEINTQLRNILQSPAEKADYVYEIRAFPLIMGTVISTVLAAGFGLVFAVLCSLFIVEFAPPRLSALMTPVVRLLAAVPSVVYGLIGILLLTPWIGRNLVSQQFKLDVKPIVPISGEGLFAAVVILTLMITPIMIAIISDALRAVPRTWMEGSTALGVNRWRTMWTIGVRTARPAIIAALVLALARALGEAIMLAMVAGNFGFTPNPLDGLNALTEPIQPLAASIVLNSEGLTVEPFGQTLYAFAAVLLVSAGLLSYAGYAAKRPMRKYGIR